LETVQDRAVFYYETLIGCRMFSCECGHFRLSVLADWLVDWPDYVGRFCPGAPLAQRGHKHGSNLPLHCSGMPPYIVFIARQHG